MAFADEEELDSKVFSDLADYLGSVLSIDAAFLSELKSNELLEEDFRSQYEILLVDKRNGSKVVFNLLRKYYSEGKVAEFCTFIAEGYPKLPSALRRVVLGRIQQDLLLNQNIR